MATALFGTTVVPSFLGHLGSAEARELNFLWYLTKPLQGEDELLSSAVSTGPGALPGTWWVSHQNVLWVGEVMTFVRFHNMWSNYNLESVPIPRCDFYFFFCLIFLFLQWIRQKKKKRRRSLRPKCTLIFQDQPKDKLCSLGPILSQNDTIGPELNHKQHPEPSPSTQMIHIVPTIRACCNGRCYLFTSLGS